MKTKKQLLKIINSVLNEIDPIGLIALGAPNDEYSVEAEMLASKLLNDGTTICNPNDVHTTFLKMFDDDLSKNECKEIADKITKNLSDC